MQAEACPLFREFDYGAGGYGFGLVVDEDKFVFVADIRVYDGLGVLEVGVAVHRRHSGLSERFLRHASEA